VGGVRRKKKREKKREKHRKKTTYPNLDKGVDGHDGEVRVAAAVVHEVEIAQLLEFEVVRLHAVDNVREKRAATSKPQTHEYV
jgi:hypothetical protein